MRSKKTDWYKKTQLTQVRTENKISDVAGMESKCLLDLVRLWSSHPSSTLLQQSFHATHDFTTERKLHLYWVVYSRWFKWPLSTVSRRFDQHENKSFFLELLKWNTGIPLHSSSQLSSTFSIKGQYLPL